MDRDLLKFYANITDVRLALWSSSWGRLQCNAETAQGKVYHSWSGDARDGISTKLIIDAFKLIGKQLQ